MKLAQNVEIKSVFLPLIFRVFFNYLIFFKVFHIFLFFIKLIACSGV